MDVICFALGIIIGAGAGSICTYFIMKNGKKEAEIFEARRREEERKERQMANFWAYDGSEKGQEEIE